MPEENLVQGLKVGSVLTGPVHVYTLDRRRWYSGGLRTAGLGQLSGPSQGGIHDSDEYAKAQGLKAPIADGMTLTNWCSTMLLKYFGLDYMETGELRTKYIKPTYLGDAVSVFGKVRTIQEGGQKGKVYDLEVWCENQDGVKVTDGDAKIAVKAR